MAIKHLKEEDNPILHSDQGWHNKMTQYQSTLQEEEGITQLNGMSPVEYRTHAQ